MSDLVIDNFAGGGGASTGIEMALGRYIDVAINHDAEAVKLHAANHPQTRHLCQSVWRADPRDVVGKNKVDLAWFSPDCKHFSKAKGGKPVEKHIRDLAWVVVHWAKLVRPAVIMLENVEEFKDWGPLISTEDGKLVPDPLQKGLTFRRWVKELQKLGYKIEWRELRACDYGAPTIRKRLFLIARCDGKPIVWPAPTHGVGLLPYRTAAECIDWSIPCPSIFERKKPLAENTLRRIAKGIQRYVIDAAEPFIVEYHSPKRDGDYRTRSLEDPLGTQTVENRFGLVTPILVGAGGPAYSGKPKKADAPLNAQTTENHAAVVAAFLAQHNTGVVGHRAAAPVSTITQTGAQQALVASHLIKMRGQNVGQPTDEPLHTVSAGGTHHAEVRAFLLKYYGTDQDPDLRAPLHTLTTKDRFGLVTVHGEEYQIVDIGMRMLTPRELYRAQGFPETYIIGDEAAQGLVLSKTAQVRMCGNSVCPPVAAALVRANFSEDIEMRRVA